MALLNRITRLFRADFHAVLDHIEEPELLLRQSLRDMEDEIGAAERRVTALAAGQESIAARIAEADAALADLDAQLDLCFQSGRDELARNTIRRKLETGQVRKHLDATRQAGEKQLADERRLLEENRATLKALRQKAELFAAQPVGAARDRNGAGDGAWMARRMTVSDEDVEIAYLREKDLRSGS